MKMPKGQQDEEKKQKPSPTEVYQAILALYKISRGEMCCNPETSFKLGTKCRNRKAKILNLALDQKREIFTISSYGTIQ